MAPAPHFHQVGDDPAIIGEGSEDLACGCGQVLVRGYLPANLLGIDILCSRCGGLTATPGLPDGATPPAGVIPVDRRDEPLPRPATVARQAALASREEIARLTRLWSPRPVPSDVFTIDAAALDVAMAEYDRLTQGRWTADLAAVAAAGPAPTAGLRSHALAWAIRHLRMVHGQPGWAWFATSEGSVATTLVAAFRHFVDCWGAHPLFGAMAAGAAERGFSLHALALFGAAKCLADSGNRIAFPLPDDVGSGISGFHLALGPTQRWDVVVEVFDRFEWPEGRPWDPPKLLAAVTESMAASQARINLRRPGLLVLSAGAARSAFDQPMVNAIERAMQAEGRRHRGLAGVAVIMPKLLATGRPNEVRFSYAFYPVSNPRFAGGLAPMVGRPPETAAE